MDEFNYELNSSEVNAAYETGLKFVSAKMFATTLFSLVCLCYLVGHLFN